MSVMTSSALSGQVVLVTGAAKRIGEALVRGFHDEGAKVAIHYHRSAENAEAVRDQLNLIRPSSAIAIGADLVCVEILPRIIDEVIQAFGRLDVLINNASTFYPTPLGTISAAQWDDLIGTNLKAPLFLAQAAAPHLRKSHGLILNLI